MGGSEFQGECEQSEPRARGRPFTRKEEFYEFYEGEWTGKGAGPGAAGAGSGATTPNAPISPLAGEALWTIFSQFRPGIVEPAPSHMWWTSTGA